MDVDREHVDGDRETGGPVIEAFGRALPDLAAATRVWRDLFAAPEDVYRDGLAFIRNSLR
jgi:D-psicose/D-tagatose/L-ribulose 3-epimerase